MKEVKGGTPLPLGLSCLALWFLAASCSRGFPSDSKVDNLDVAVKVLVDGSVDVTERWRVTFGETPVESFRRHLSVRRHDGVFDISGAMGKTVMPTGDGEGQIAVGRGADLDVRWQFAPVSRSPHDFTLNYRAANAVEISGLRGTLSWRFLESRRSFDVGAAAVTISLPANAILLEDPWVDEAGWDVSRLADGMSASRRDVASDESATAGLAFTIDAMAAGEPAWQYHDRRARDLMPAFISGGLFLLVVGAGVVWMVRLRFPSDQPREGPVLSHPVTGAMALVVERGQCRGDNLEIEAALDAVDARGAQSSERVTLTHERVLLDERWYAGRKTDAPWPWSRGIRAKFRRALIDDMVAAGLVDRERVDAVRDLARAGWFTLAFGVMSWTAVALTLGHFGPWPLAMPAGFLGAGVMFLAGSRRLSFLSQNGMRARARVLYSARVRDGRTSA